MIRASVLKGVIVLTSALAITVPATARVSLNASSVSPHVRSTRFIALHTNRVLAKKCLPTFSLAGASRAQWIGRHKAAHKRARGVCSPWYVRNVPSWFHSLMMCVHPYESSNWYLDGHHDGGLQFDPGTWRAARGTVFRAYAYQATPDQQIWAAWNLTHGDRDALYIHWGQTVWHCL